MSKIFKEANRVSKYRSEHVSPTGEYKLVVDSYRTGKGTWNYTQGTIYRKGSDEPIAVIQRNYSAFPFTWVDSHPNGHVYLIGGANYQGQTVLELDTGRRRDFVPEEAKKGVGFCWAVHKFNPASGILTVDGCFWACPYEFRFYDFSEPIEKGWPELDMGEHYASADHRWPEVCPDGIVMVFQTEENDDDDDDDSEEDKVELLPVAATQTFRREGLKLVRVSEWVSDKEQARRKANEEARQRYEAWLEDFKTNDPLYTTCLKLSEDFGPKPSYPFGIGVTYDGWCPDWEGNEKRICFHLMRTKTLSIEVEWGHETGPILVAVQKGKKFERKFFHDHSVDGMEAALTYAKEALCM